MSTITYPRFRSNGRLLPEAPGDPNWSLLAQAGFTDTHARMPIIHGISAF